MQIGGIREKNCPYFYLFFKNTTPVDVL